jgi:hypothetical protein
VSIKDQHLSVTVASRESWVLWFFFCFLPNQVHIMSGPKSQVVCEIEGSYMAYLQSIRHFLKQWFE